MIHVYDTNALTEREQSMRKVGLVILTLCTALLSINIAEAVEDSPSSRATLRNGNGSGLAYCLLRLNL